MLGLAVVATTATGCALSHRLDRAPEVVVHQGPVDGGDAGPPPAVQPPPAPQPPLAPPQPMLVDGGPEEPGPPVPLSTWYPTCDPPGAAVELEEALSTFRAHIPLDAFHIFMPTAPFHDRQARSLQLAYTAGDLCAGIDEADCDTETGRILAAWPGYHPVAIARFGDAIVEMDHRDLTRWALWGLEVDSAQAAALNAVIVGLRVLCEAGPDAAEVPDTYVEQFSDHYLVHGVRSAGCDRLDPGTVAIDLQGGHGATTAATNGSMNCFE